MKLTKLFQSIGLIAIISLAVSCKEDTTCSNGVKDGNETGIDCGGDCPACPVSNEADPRLFGDWYLAYLDSSNSYGAYSLKVYTSTDCRVEIINENISTTDTPIYKIKGALGSSCSYPVEGTLTYDAATISKIQILNADTLKYNGFVYVRNSNPYANELPYAKFRLYVLNNECGDSAIIGTNNLELANNLIFNNSTDPYMEVVTQSTSPSGNVLAIYRWNTNQRDPAFPTMPLGPPLSWYVPNPTRNYDVTYQIQILDKNNNVLVISSPTTKTIWGNDLSNRLGYTYNVQWVE